MFKAMDNLVRPCLKGKRGKRAGHVTPYLVGRLLSLFEAVDLLLSNTHVQTHTQPSWVWEWWTHL